MRFINFYLVGYVLFIVGILLGLWRAGVLHRFSPVWTLIGLVVAVGIRIMLSVSSGKPTITDDRH